MKALLLLGSAPVILLAAPAAAQTMDHSKMPGMTMPAKPTPEPVPEASEQPTAPAVSQDSASAPDAPDCPPEHAQMGHCTPKPTADPHAGHAMPGADQATSPMDMSGTALPAGNAPAPQPPSDHYADRQFPPEEMAEARRQMMFEQGGQPFYQVMFNLAEYQAREGADGFRWDGEGWFGGDINRLVVKTEGSGAFGEGVDDAEIQALYSRAIGPYFNLQAGIRYDFEPNPSRTYATVGFEGLAPYWFEVEGALFLSDKGDVLGRLEGYYDQRITQRLILQPRAELNLAAQDVPENGIGSGLSDIELGLRLRYEVARQFAPYVGVSWDRKLGDTADFARAAGENPSSTSFVFGIRTWF
ncbi:MAG: copper resistance protein B [Alphaproteobacteria bacterium]|nr:copper resistance protein B [Alphaproteobacteria bacterium]